MPDPASAKRSLPNWMGYLLVIATVLLASLLFTREQNVVPSYDIAYSHFLTLVREGAVTQVTLHDKRIEGTLQRSMPIGPQNAEAEHFTSRLPAHFGVFPNTCPFDPSERRHWRR